MNNYTANNSSVKDVMLDQTIEKTSYFKCTACYWDNDELIMCPKCKKFKEQWDELNNVTTMTNHESARELRANNAQELLGCLIYVFGIVVAFGLLIWSTM